jgi:hypothetical protein
MEVKTYANCEYCWEGSDEDNVDEREPCPECGSTARRISVHVEERLALRESIGGKIKDQKLPSRKKVRVEFFDGYEWSVALEKVIKKSRLIDKREDLYHERIEDPETGEIIHECKESLTEHQGHGYAKLRSKKDH